MLDKQITLLMEMIKKQTPPNNNTWGKPGQQTKKIRNKPCQ